MKRRKCRLIAGITGILLLGMTGSLCANELDDRVSRFLEENRRAWQDLNIPTVDGQTLHALIVERGFTRGYEIGTSTGHSTVGIAWAMSKTGGKLITVELDERRHRIARENIEAAGLSDYVEFIHGNAHEITPAQTGKFDFVFSDADKNWYVQYFKDMYPQLTDNACFTSHNIRESSRRFSRRRRGGDYLDYVRTIEDLETRVDSRGSGLAISCKK